MTPEPCPECKGKCCRDDYGYRIDHMGAEHYEHVCEACWDGDKYVPPHTYEQGALYVNNINRKLERMGVPVRIERGKHRREEKN